MRRATLLATAFLLAACASASARKARRPAVAATVTVPVTGSATTTDGRPVTVSGSVSVTVGDVPAPAPGPVVTVPAGSSLQAALNAAAAGTTLVLSSGATYPGPLTLPVKSGSAWTTLQSSRIDALPPEGFRVAPAESALMPKLTTAGGAAIATAPGAHHYRLVGLEITKASALAAVDTLITLGDGSPAQNSLALAPHDLVLDRCYVHGLAGNELKRGVGLNSAATTITGCTVNEVKGKGYDTQAIGGWNGPGPFTITNNQLEAAGEVIMFGGADPAIPNLVPTGITIQGNTLTRPLGWRGMWTVKNLLELKNARSVTIDGNDLANNWADGQSGFAVLFTTRNQEGGAPWSVVSDVSFTNNRIRHTGSVFSLLGKDDLQPSQQGVRLRVAGNLAFDVDGVKWGGRGAWMQVDGFPSLTVEHNTALITGMPLLAYGSPSPGLIWRNNLMPANNLGVVGDGVGFGTVALEHYFPGYVWAGNVLVGASPVQYPAGTFCPATLDQVGFVDLAGGNYQLAATSPYRGKATDGADVGMDASRLPKSSPGRRR